MGNTMSSPRVCIACGAAETPTVELLVNSESPLTLSIKTASLNVVHGLCALLWARPEGAPLRVDLTGCNIGPKGLSVLARAVTDATWRLRAGRR